MISSVDLAHYGVYRAKDWVSVDCGTTLICNVVRAGKPCTVPLIRQIGSLEVNPAFITVVGSLSGTFASPRNGI